MFGVLFVYPKVLVRHQAGPAAADRLTFPVGVVAMQHSSSTGASVTMSFGHKLMCHWREPGSPKGRCLEVPV